jgi:hypothetical protein
MNLTKTISIDEEALPILAAMTWEQIGGKLIGKLTCGQLERELYLKVNKALDALGGKWQRKHGGHVFETDPRPMLQGVLETGAVEVVKDGYYCTPQWIGEKMAVMALLRPGMRVLEPSAGTGNLALAIKAQCPGVDLWVAEKNQDRQRVLKEKGYQLLVEGDYDFLTHDVGKWDRIIQNPPFEQGQDMDHVMRAHGCLLPGGILVSVMSESPFFVDYSLHKAFRDWLGQYPHDVLELPPNAFKESGSGAQARLVRVGGIQ